MIKKIFNDEYKIVMLSNGKEAIEYFENNKNKNVTESIDNVLGIFLDLTMPVLDGFAVLDYFKQKGLFEKIPVSIITGDSSKETISRVMTYNIVDILIKPFSAFDIEKLVSKMVK